MELTIKGNINYCASIVSIKNIIDLEGCNNIKGTIIFGNHVIVSKDVKIGELGIYFPVECRISDEFLSHNNLFDKPEFNRDKTKKGFFSTKGRVRAVKLRGFQSDGFWIPIQSLLGLISQKDIDQFKEGDSFDHINGNKVCEKYFVPCHNSGSSNKRKETKANKKFSRIIKEQFHFHIDTPLLGRCIGNINPDQIISITQKLHGSSFIVSNILCNKKLNVFEKTLKKIGVNIRTTEYEGVYASRKVIKNQYINENVSKGYYGVDLWGVVDKELKSFIKTGMTLYGEVVGYIPESDKAIQKNYDYGCNPGQHENYIYRITTTSEDNVVYEWSMLQVQQWCKKNGLKAVPLLYYGKVGQLFAKLYMTHYKVTGNSIPEYDSNTFLDLLTKEYLEKKCTKENFDVFCSNDVWDEGVVLRVENLDIESYKLKSFNFKCQESKQLDSGETNIEDNQEA